MHLLRSRRFLHAPPSFGHSSLAFGLAFGLASGLALAACSSSSSPSEPDASAREAGNGHEAATPEAGVDASRDADGSKNPDGGDVQDAMHDQDAAADAGCAPKELAIDAGAVGTHAVAAGGACTRDIDCAKGGFCIVVEGKCASPSIVQGPGEGGHAKDGGACEPAAAFDTCDPNALAWSDPKNVSETTTSLSECDSALVTDGKGKIVVAWTNNLVGGDQQTNGLAVSVDDGKTFKAGQAPVHLSTDAENDGQLAIDNQGLLYFLWEGYASAETGAQHVYASTSKDAVTWSPALQIDAAGDDGNGATPLDFPFLAINPVNDQPYFTYQVTASSGAIPIKLVIGTTGADGGLPTSTELDDGKRPDSYRDLVNGAFDAQGNFYAAWVELVGESWATGEGLDSGATGDGVYVTRVDLNAAGQTVPSGHDVLASGASESVAFGLPRVLVTPDASSVYVLYTEGTKNALDLRVAKSLDGGNTFLPSVKVNDDATCATHFKAAATLDATGRLWVAWYDNREGEGRLVSAVSTDGAKSFHPNQLVTPYAFPFQTFEYSVGWLGDYFQLAASKTTLYAAWPDPHANDQSHIQFAKAELPAP